MSIRERDIEDVLYSRPHLIPDIYIGIGIAKWLARQYSVPSGRIDLLGLVDCGAWKSPVVVELKRGPIDDHALTQVCRYAGDIANIIEIISNTYGVLSVGDARVHKVVIGQSIDHKTHLAADGMGVIVFTYSAAQPDKLALTSVEERNTTQRWGSYEQLSQDSPFEYWVKQARAEIAKLFRGAA